MRRRILIVILLVLLLVACQPGGFVPTVRHPAGTNPAGQLVKAEPTINATATAAPKAVMLEPQGFIQHIHDPVIAHAGDTYYVFSTGSRIPFICSKDKVVWEFCGRIFESNPAWTREINRDLVDIWAPDISFFNDRWHLYYAVSNFGSQNSAIGLATNVTLDLESPDYKWVDGGEVLRSHPGDQWNAIDPNLVLDENDQPWLAFGSFWGGIKLRKLERTTGKLAVTDQNLYSLASRPRTPGTPGAIEAPNIIRKQSYYYLFVSFDFCCRGKDSTYNIRVGRARSITGPYVDREGKPMMDGGGTLVIAGGGRWAGPGHCSVLQENKIAWLIYHAYDTEWHGVATLRIAALRWDSEGWPTISP